VCVAEQVVEILADIRKGFPEAYQHVQEKVGSSADGPISTKPLDTSGVRALALTNSSMDCM
jgi:hypothetical protein